MGMSWNYFMGLVAAIALFLPITLIFTLRLATYRTFPVLLVYYIAVVTNNLFAQGCFKASPEVINIMGVTNNLLDAPLMLYFMTYFSTSSLFTKSLKIFILSYIVFEATVIGMRGFNVEAVVIVMAPGLFSVLVVSLYFFIRQVKITILYRKAAGKALMISSLLFAYGCYGIIYLMFYIFVTPNKEETFTIYFLVTTFAAILMTIGIIIERKRVTKLNELIVTRRELSVVYKEESKPAIPMKAIVIENERFN